MLQQGLRKYLEKIHDSRVPSLRHPSFLKFLLLVRYHDLTVSSHATPEYLVKFILFNKKEKDMKNLIEHNNKILL